MARIKYKEAVGLQVKRGRPSAKTVPEKEQLIKLYVKERRSIRDIGASFGYSKDMIHRALKRYGIEVRTSARRSILLKYSLSDLKAAVREKGIRGYARELGIDEGTLRHHLKTRKGK